MTSAISHRHRHRRGASSRLILLVVCSATFMSFLDLSVVNVAFPQIATDFPLTSLATLSWVVSGYAVMFAAFLAPAGRLADAFGRRLVFVIALTSFVAASALCGAAQNHELLLTGRVVQGIAAAGMIPAALGLLLEHTPPAKLIGAIGAWSASAGFSAVVGPVVGGLLIELASWRAVFFINVPVGLLTLLLALRVLPRSSAHPQSGVPDVMGTALLVVGTAGVVTGVTEGSEWGWSAPETLIAIVGGVLLTILAVHRSTKHEHPAIQVDLWSTSPQFAVVCITNAVIGISMFAFLLAGPIFLAQIWRWGTLDSSLALTVGGVASMFASVMVGRTSGVHMRSVFVLLGCTMFGASCFWMSSDMFSQEVHLFSAWVPAGVLGGGGLGLAITGLGSIAAASIDPRRFAAGMGMTLASRQVGGAIGVAMLATILSSASSPLSGLHRVFVTSGVLCLVAMVLSVVLIRMSSAAGRVSANG